MWETMVSVRIMPSFELPHLLFSDQVGYYASGYAVIRFVKAYSFSAQCESSGTPLHQHLEKYVA